MSQSRKLVDLLLQRKLFSRRPLQSKSFCLSTTQSYPNGGHGGDPNNLPREPGHEPGLESFSLLIPVTEYRERQLKLLSLVSQRCGGRNCLLLIPSAERHYQADTNIPSIHFKQSSDFTYLTGLNSYEASGSVLALFGEAVNNQEQPRSLLFAPHLSANQILWEGPGLLSSENSKWLSSICNSVEDVKEFEKFFEQHLNTKKRIFLTKTGLQARDTLNSRRSNQTQSVLSRICLSPQLINQSESVPAEELTPLIDELRLCKSSNELAAMKRTCAIGANAVKATMSWTAEQTSTNSSTFNMPLVKESQIEAKFDYESRLNGATKVAYPSVVAGADRATVIHYGSNNKFVGPSDWVLMDAGCEDIEGYNSDITRCWAAGGDVTQDKLRFALYQALCEVHQALVAALSDKALSLDNLFNLMCRLLGKVLIEFNVIPKSSSTQDCARLAYKFCPHHVSHYLGLDVHDTPSISRSIPIRPGMCFTVEPGLYFKHQDDIKNEFKGIGIRVEDDLCVELDGQITVMTAACPQMFTKRDKAT